MNNKFKKAWNIVTTIIVAMFVVLAVLLVGVRLIGLTPLCVLSGSMEPTYKTGSIIYVKSVDATSIKVKDPITFYMNNSKTVATHRVVRIDSQNQSFYTKGDANNIEDPMPVAFSSLIGKPIFTIPYLGYLSAFITTPPGSYISIAFGGVIVLFSILSGSSEKRKKEEDERQA
ncbi:MAG: signal peptidase I [Clostridia bacterium]|nr:signal peptidase I [Clostridia bacterium]